MILQYKSAEGKKNRKKFFALFSSSLKLLLLILFLFPAASTLKIRVTIQEIFNFLLTELREFATRMNIL